MPETIFCRFCGKEIQADALFCPHCGKSLQNTIIPPAEEKPAVQPAASPNSIPANRVVPQKAGKGKIILLVILGLGVLLCLGFLLVSFVVMPRVVGASLPEIIMSEATALSGSYKALEMEKTLIPMQTEAAIQEAKIRKWVVPLLFLMTAENAADELLQSFNQIADGSMTVNEFRDRLMEPDVIEVMEVFLEEKDSVQENFSQRGLVLETAVLPFLFGLEDDFETLSRIQVRWLFDERDTEWSITDTSKARETLKTEREKMHQAILLDGLTEENYLYLIQYCENQWPSFKAKLDNQLIKAMTPQP